MEAIKFRAKSLEMKKWVYGFYCNIENKEHYILQNSVLGLYHNLVVPETVGMFTGKHTIKGQEIFEGDLLFSEELDENDNDIRYVYVCVWIKEFAGFCFLHITDEWPLYKESGIESFDQLLINTYNLEDAEKMHYAGNIFDNPELTNE